MFKGMRTGCVTWVGEVIGTAGAGLVDAAWAANRRVAEVGRLGELRTAELLEPMCRSDGFTVLHDLRIPIPGFAANIDHAVVAGRTVLLIHSKVWKAGRYWTVAGTTSRGWHRFSHAETRTPAMAFEHIGRFLAGRRVTADMCEPLVAVWPSARHGRVSVRWLKMCGCRPVRAAQLPRLVRRVLPREPAHPAVVAALRELVNDAPHGTSRQSSAARTGGWNSERSGHIRPGRKTELPVAQRNARGNSSVPDSHAAAIYPHSRGLFDRHARE